MLWKNNSQNSLHCLPFLYEKGGKTIKQYFRKAWLSEYHWLVWSPSKEGAYCKYCVLFAKVPQGRCRGGELLGTLVVTPFQDFKNAKGREGVLDKHESYQYHKDAVLMGKAFLEQCRNPALRVLDMQSQELMKSNRLALKSIVECIIFCGKQGISFRGQEMTTQQMVVRIKEFFWLCWNSEPGQMQHFRTSLQMHLEMLVICLKQFKTNFLETM